MDSLIIFSRTAPRHTLLCVKVSIKLSNLMKYGNRKNLRKFPLWIFFLNILTTADSHFKATHPHHNNSTEEDSGYYTIGT